MKKSVIAFVVLALLFAMPLASAGFWQWLTGHDIASELLTHVNITVANTVPVVNETIIAPDPAYRANTLNCTARYYDHDSDSATLNFTWYNGSTPYSSELKTLVATGALTTVFLSPGVQGKAETWECRVFANDTIDNSSPSSDFITISNTAPTIAWVATISAVTPTENGTTNVTFKFMAQDNDGYGDITGTAHATFKKSGETTREADCSATGGEASGDSKNYTCIIGMLFYDAAGVDWNVNVSIQDSSGAPASDNSKSFTYNPLTAFTLAPSPITWGVLAPGAPDQGATNDPSVLTNTGNFPVTVISINATDLTGVTVPANTIAAGNFTANIADITCTGALSTGIFTTVSSAALPKGASSTEQIYYCLDVPATTVRQLYNTATSGAWTIKIA